jgi:hypothetical protein
MIGWHLYRHTFTNEDFKLETFRLPSDISDGFFARHANRIYLVEISSNTDPSDLAITITWNEGTKRLSQIIHFSLYRSLFIYQKDKFILDTSEIDLFTVPLLGQFTIEFASEFTKQPFTANIYFKHLPTE